MNVTYHQDLLCYCRMSFDISRWPIFSLLDLELVTNITQAWVFGSSGNEAIFITKDDDVYSLGSNCSGCLGLSSYMNYT